ncbi:MAG: glutathione S-transferase [Pseudomonadota bacterium]
MSDIIYYCGNKNYSSWSLRGWLALKKAGIDFETKMIPLGGEISQKQLYQISPNGKVPAIDYHGLLFSESLAICELAAQIEPKLMPEDQKAIIWCRAISCEMHSGFQTVRSQMPMNCNATNRNVSYHQKLVEEIERILTIWRQTIDRFADIDQGPFLFGRFTIADAMYAPVVSRFHTYNIKCDPSTQNYISAVLNDEHVKQWYHDASKETQYIPNSEYGYAR